MTETSKGWAFELTGGALCLDFANSIGGMRGGAEREHLNSYQDLVSWGRQAGVLTPAAAARLSHQGTPGQQASALRRAKGLREAVYRIFVAEAGSHEPDSADLEVLNAVLSAEAGRQRLRRTGRAWTMEWDDEPTVDFVLGPVAHSAAELLCSQRLERIRHCEACAEGECDWVFLDTTKNKSRRWCDMEVCGNRAKARRHLERKKAGLSA